jgi:hypothetical protein
VSRIYYVLKNQKPYELGIVNKTWLDNDIWKKEIRQLPFKFKKINPGPPNNVWDTGSLLIVCGLGSQTTL